MFHLPSLFILYCELDVKVLLMAASHRITGAFPAVWWAKRSIREGARTGPWAEQKVIPRGRRYQSSPSVLKWNGSLPSVAEAARARSGPPAQGEGGRLCPAPTWHEARQRPHACGWGVVLARAKPAPGDSVQPDPRSRSSLPDAKGVSRAPSSFLRVSRPADPALASAAGAQSWGVP